MTDPLPDAIYKSLTFKTNRGARSQSFNEAYLGFGYLFTSTDYGSAWNGKDEDIIAYVRNQTYVQACKVARDDGLMCDYVLIDIHPQGYSVNAIFEQKTTNEPTTAA